MKINLLDVVFSFLFLFEHLAYFLFFLGVRCHDIINFAHGRVQNLVDRKVFSCDAGYQLSPRTNSVRCSKGMLIGAIPECVGKLK